ncbi:MAG: pyrroline-5-carboxylate reductase [Eubacteriales bacterium]|nr:pyrroline-5-carboxylate reductase [Eubacteriales bacterium]
MNKRLGFMGCGNMGSAVINGICAAKLLKGQEINVYDVSQERLIAMVDEYQVNPYKDLDRFLENTDVIFLAVKPQICQSVLSDLAPRIKGRNKAILTIVAGWPNARYYETLSEDVRLLRIMPNTPALCCKAMSVLCAENTLTEEEFAFARQIFEAVGQVEVLSEHLFDAVTGVSGSGPAYVFLLIEAMANGGVLMGLPAPTARKLAAQTFAGAAEMVLIGDQHPAALKDAVSSPAGTTIEALYQLEKAGVRGAMISAVESAARRSEELAKGSK